MEWEEYIKCRLPSALLVACIYRLRSIAAHPHLAAQSVEHSFHASVRARHITSHALECLHLVGGETAAPTAAAEGHQCPAILRAKTGQSCGWTICIRRRH